MMTMTESEWQNQITSVWLLVPPRHCSTLATCRAVVYNRAKVRTNYRVDKAGIYRAAVELSECGQDDVINNEVLIGIESMPDALQRVCDDMARWRSWADDTAVMSVKIRREWGRQSWLCVLIAPANRRGLYMTQPSARRTTP